MNLQTATYKEQIGMETYSHGYSAQSGSRLTDVMISAIVCLLFVMFMGAADPMLFHWFLIPLFACGVIIGADTVGWFRSRWDVLDPKGIIGELEYEIGAALRNPYEMPGLLAEPSAIARRVECFARKLNLNVGRTLAWAFAQAVLSAAWAVEDGFTIGPKSPSMALANAIRPML